MNRVIKFRAWITSERTMIQHREVIERAHLQFEDSLNDVDVVMQFTGLTDKNGKEIYEGDIGKVHHGDPFAPKALVFVVFENGSFGVYPLKNQTDIFGNKYTGKMLCFSDGYKKESFEIIGNIYENPELLKP